MNEPKTDRSGVGILVLLTIIWGSTFLFTALSLEHFPPIQIAAARLIVGGLLLLLVVVLRRQSFTGLLRHWAWLAPLCLINFAIPFYLMARAQVSVPSSVTAFFISAIPLFTLLLSRVVLKEAVSPRRWIGFFIGFSGLIWLSGSASTDPAMLSGLSTGDGSVAILLLLLATLCFAVGSIIIRRMPPVPSLPATTLLLLAGGLALVPLGGSDLAGNTRGLLASQFGTAHGVMFGPAMVALASLIFLGLLPTGVGQVLRTVTIQRHGPVFFSVVGFAVPIWATVLGIVFLGEELTLEVTLAFAVILGGLWLAHDGGFASQR